jgi:uncharacterized membrane protein YcgQ (UPF0703/DUF1980 family)
VCRDGHHYQGNPQWMTLMLMIGCFGSLSYVVPRYVSIYEQQICGHKALFCKARLWKLASSLITFTIRMTLIGLLSTLQHAMAYALSVHHF